MSDARAQMRQGEKRPVYSTHGLSPGSVGTIQSVPAPVCTLFDETDTPVAGIDGVVVTGYTPGASAKPKVWYLLDNSAQTLAAGLYTLVFTYSLAGSDGVVEEVEASVEIEMLEEPHLPRAAQICRSRLLETAQSFPDGELYPELDLMLIELEARFTVLGDATLLTGNDRKFFEQAVGLFVAAKLRASRPKRAPTGEISDIRTGSQEFAFDNLDRARLRDITTVEEQWVAEANVALGKVSMIRSFLQAAGSWSPFVLSGPTRNVEQSGYIETLISSDIRLLTDKFILDIDDTIDYGDDPNA